MGYRRERTAQDFLYNAMTSELDRAIRLLAQAEKLRNEDRLFSAGEMEREAVRILQTIGPERLIIDPEAKL